MRLADEMTDDVVVTTGSLRGRPATVVERAPGQRVVVAVFFPERIERHVLPVAAVETFPGSAGTDASTLAGHPVFAPV